MSELRELYQELIIDHSKRPRNFCELADANRKAEGFNPLCGDHVWIHVKLVDDRIDNIGFQGKGCAICTASASVMTEAIRGKTEKEARELFERFHALVTGKAGGDRESLGKLAAFAGVSEFPVRVKCASLPWHTLTAALDDCATVTTE